MYKNKILILHSNTASSKQLVKKIIQETYTSTTPKTDDIAVDDEVPILKDLLLSNRYYEITNDLYIDEFDTAKEGFQTWFNEFCQKDIYEMLYNCLAGIVIVQDSTTPGIDDNIRNMEQISEFLANQGYSNKFYVLYNERITNELDSSNSSDSDSDSENIFVHDTIELCESFSDYKTSLDVYDWLQHKENKEIYSFHQEETKSFAQPKDLGQIMQALETKKNTYQSMENEEEAQEYLNHIVEEMSDLLLK